MITFDRITFRAGSFLNAAEALMPNRQDVNTFANNNFKAPILYLLGHALELSLKSFLLFVVHSENAQSYQSTNYGHDLKRIFETCKNAGIQKECENFLNIEKISLNYAHVYPNDLRYPEGTVRTQVYLELEDFDIFSVDPSEEHIDLLHPYDSYSEIKLLLEELIARFSHAQDTEVDVA